MNSLRLLVIAWMLLWLAGNGVLAAVMPFCKHALGQHGDHAVAMSHHHASAGAHEQHASHQHHQSPDAKGDAKPSGLMGVVCDNCDLCHLATSVMPTEGVPASLSIDRTYQAGPIVIPASRFPEKPLHVPVSQRA